MTKLFALSRQTVVLIVGFLIGAVMQPGSPARAQSSDRIFELRTYTVADGKADALSDIFRDHIMKLLAKNGMTNVGYWIPQDEPRSKDTLIYIVAHKSRDAATQNWAAFRNDPTAKDFREAEARLGVKVTKVESVFMAPTGYSPIK
jgi:hypothetical protein